MNEVLKAIFGWQSVHRFTQKQITQEELQQVLKAGLHAPKSNMDERCFFLVLQNADRLAELNRLVKDAFFRWNTDESTNEVVLKNKRESSRSNYNFHYKAPTLIVVSSNREYVGAVADSAYALQNIILAAASLGISSTLVQQLDWLRDHPRIVGFLEDLGLPENHIICGSVALGYRDAKPQVDTTQTNGHVKII